MSTPIDVWRDRYGDTVELTLTPNAGEDVVSLSDGRSPVVIHTARPITLVEKGRDWSLRHEMLGWKILSLFGTIFGFLLGWVACFEGWIR